MRARSFADALAVGFIRACLRCALLLVAVMAATNHGALIWVAP